MRRAPLARAPRPAAPLALLLAACAVGPDHRPPAASVPESWSAAPDAGVSGEPLAEVRWWTLFGDAHLTSLVERAVASSPEARLARERVREARALRGLAQAELRPRAGASASAARQRISENEPILGSLAPVDRVPFENDVYQAGFDASWELDLFGGRRRALEAAAADVAAGEADRRDVLVSLLAEVTREYVELRAVQQRLAVAREQARLQEEALEIARWRFEGGLTSALDVTRAAALLAGTRAEVPALESQGRAAMHRLAVLVGEPPGALVAELSEPRPLPPTPPEVPVGLPSGLLRRRPDVRAAERRLAAATARIGVETAELFPRLALTGDLGLRSVDSGTLLDASSRTFSIGPTIRWSLLDLGRARARIDAQDARQAQALARYEQAVLTALREVEDAIYAYANETSRRAAVLEETRELESSVEIASALYAEGRVGYLDVVDAQRSLHAARDRLVRSEQAALEHLIALYKGLGGGWEPFEEAGAAAASP